MSSEKYLMLFHILTLFRAGAHREIFFLTHNQQPLVSWRITFSENYCLCPGISRDHLRRLLKEMKATGQIICIGRGPGAKWQKRKEGHIPKRGS